MRLFISGDPHVNLGTWNHTTHEMCARRSAVSSVFIEGLKKARTHKCDAYMHTGDFLEGPLANPNLTSSEYNFYRDFVKRSRKFFNFVTCPVGNHDIPKSRYSHYKGSYPTVWSNMVGDLVQTPDILVLDFCPNGQEAATEQFQEKLKKFQPKGPWLVVAHHLMEGNFEFNSNSIPSHENWFQKKWITQLREKGPNGTVVLGHDHNLWEFVQDGVQVINVGSPTAMVAGDQKKRQFLVWDSKTGTIESIPVKLGLKETTLTSLDNIPEDVHRVVLDVDIRTQEDEERLKEVISSLHAKGIEYIDKTNLFKDDVNTVDLSSTFGIQDAFEKFIKDNQVPNNIKEVAANMLAEMKVC